MSSRSFWIGRNSVVALIIHPLKIINVLENVKLEHSVKFFYFVIKHTQC